MKILVLQRVILPYRVPFYNALNEKVDLTVAYYMYDKTGDECQFKKIKITANKLGPVYTQKGVRKLANQFDVVVIGTDLHALSYIVLPFFPHKYHLLSWGIGFRVSHTHPFVVDRKHNLLDRITEIIMSKCEANIFYMPQVKQFWKNSSLKQEKMFVAPNTVEVANVVCDNEKKKNIIFVGTLYKGKGVDALLRSVSEAKKRVCNFFHVDIIGDGPCRLELEVLSNSLGLANNVSFHGAIFDSKELSHLYSTALCCVSPYQAGLSVCTSMGNGVPFITKANAITGGEICHITDGLNGVLYRKDEDLTGILIDVIDNPSKYIEMGSKAKDYYDNKASILHMVKGFMSAIEYATSK